MKVIRECSKPYCHERAVATLTYVYSDAALVIGPMATSVEPHSYDLCQHHVETLKAPRGWTVQQLVSDFVPAQPHDDDLDALAQVVRKASQQAKMQQQRPRTQMRPPMKTLRAEAEKAQMPDFSRSEVARMGHLRLLQGGAEDAHTDASDNS